MITTSHIEKSRSKGKIRLYSAALAHTAFSGAVVTERTAFQPMRLQAKAAHTDFDLCCHTAVCRPSASLPFKCSPPP